MSAQLQQAIASLHLQPGQTYRTTVNGHEVEVRILERSSPAEPLEEKSELDDMVMMEPWFNMPSSPVAKRITVRRGKPVLPPPIELEESDLAPE